jgi:hypothetical protein
MPCSLDWLNAFLRMSNPSCPKVRHYTPVEAEKNVPAAKMPSGLENDGFNVGIPVLKDEFP